MKKVSLVVLILLSVFSCTEERRTKKNPVKEAATTPVKEAATTPVKEPVKTPVVKPVEVKPVEVKPVVVPVKEPEVVPVVVPDVQPVVVKPVYTPEVIQAFKKLRTDVKAAGLFFPKKASPSAKDMQGCIDYLGKKRAETQAITSPKTLESKPFKSFRASVKKSKTGRRYIEYRKGSKRDYGTKFKYGYYVGKEGNAYKFAEVSPYKGHVATKHCTCHRHGNHPIYGYKVTYRIVKTLSESTKIRIDSSYRSKLNSRAKETYKQDKEDRIATLDKLIADARAIKNKVR